MTIRKVLKDNISSRLVECINTKINIVKIEAYHKRGYNIRELVTPT